jgi:hypothetical protein
MTEEMSVALSDMGVAKEFLDAEPYFNRRHQAGAATIEAIRERRPVLALRAPAYRAVPPRVAAARRQRRPHGPLRREPAHAATRPAATAAIGPKPC